MRKPLSGKRCRKVRYRDEVAANLALAVLRRQDKPGHTEVRAYACPRCRGWHLTSQTTWGEEAPCPAS